MPIELPFSMQRLSQKEFGEIAYEVVNFAMEAHRELGRFADEDIYSTILGDHFGDRSVRETLLRINHKGFKKDYYLDLIIDQCALFEFKACTAISSAHKAQLLTYLMLAELAHGKLINFRPSELQHQFVNCRQLLEQRTKSEIFMSAIPSNFSETAEKLQTILGDIICDIGTGLESSLYKEMAIHFFGGDQAILQDIPISFRSQPAGSQKLPILQNGLALQVTCLTSPKTHSNIQYHSKRLLRSTKLTAILWANITPNNLSISLIKN